MPGGLSRKLEKFFMMILEYLLNAYEIHPIHKVYILPFLPL